jgi:histidine triad (HIT) family protein
MRDGCPFCDYDGPSEVLCEYFGGDVFVIEPIDPVTLGHVLVIPRLHVPSFAEFEAGHAEAMADTFAAACAWARDSRSAAGWDANLLTSAGPLATQTVPHLHVHVVPRRPGDGLALPWDNPVFVPRNRRFERADG